MIESVGICNATCQYCPQGAGMLKKPEKSQVFLTPTVLEKALYLAKKGNQKAIYLHHRGEPLLHPNIGYIVKTIRKAGFFAYISTNMIAATEKKLKDVLLAGANEFEVHISAGLTKITIETLLEKIHFLRKMNWEIRNNGCKIKMNYALQGNETEDSVRDILSSSQFYDEDMPIRFYKPHDWPGIMSTDEDLSTTSNKIPLMSPEDCEWYKTESCAILANGDVVICCLDQKAYSKKVNIMDIDELNFEHLSNRKICERCVFHKWNMDWLKRDALSIPGSISRRQIIDAIKKNGDEISV